MTRIDGVALVAAIAAGLLALTAGRGEFGYLSTIAGVSLLLVLFAYDEHGYRSGLQSFGYAAVCGFCLVLAAGFAFEASGFLKTAAAPNAAEPHWNKVLSIIWLVATGVFWGVDRARMGARESLSLREPSQTMVGGTAPAVTRTPRISREAVPVSYPEPAAHAVHSPEAAPPVEFSAPIMETPSIIEAASTRANAVPGPAGKPVDIFVNLVGEGMNVLRSVRAEHLGRDFYIIVDEMPTGETWEFQTGQVVRCRKKNLSNGKGLVAYEEAPRAQ